MKEVYYATVCSGIECCSVALRGMPNWKPLFFSEIEFFPCQMLAWHYPSVPNLGDMTKIHYDAEKDEIGNGTTVIRLHGKKLGALCGGTPCQDVSVAGARAGMSEGSGTRSSLAFHFVRIADELKPKFLLWENVPGCLSSNHGRDFARFVQAITEIGYCVAWRILDCQYTRVDEFPYAIPQRRRRVWVVGVLGTDRNAPAEILFEQPSVCGSNPPSRTKEAGVTGILGWNLAMANHCGPCFRASSTGTTSNGDDCFPTIDTRIANLPNQQADIRGGVHPIQTQGLTASSCRTGKRI